MEIGLLADGKVILRTFANLAFCWVVAMHGIAVVAAELRWPDGFQLEEGSASPNGRYGLLVPEADKDKDANGTDDKDMNYIVDLKAHRVLGQIPEGTYSFGRNRQIWVIWAKNSEFATAAYSYRAGMDAVLVWQFRESAFKQDSIDGHVREALNRVIQKGARNQQIGRFPIDFYTRVLDDGKVLVRALSSTKPFEATASDETMAGFFQATYDAKSGHWTGEQARVVTQERYQTLEDAYGTDEEPAEDDARAKYLDGRMNQIYDGLRLVLSAKRFERVKEDQKTWLIKCDSAGSTGEKNKMVRARIETMQDLLW
jgi:hypothetical protein